MEVRTNDAETEAFASRGQTPCECGREVGRRTEGLPETERGGEEADAGTADRQSFIKKELRQKRFAAAFGL